MLGRCIRGYTNPKTPPEKLAAQPVDLQWHASFLFLTSLPRRRGGRFANHALQQTAPRVTVRAFFERSAIDIWASSIRSAFGHAPRHAPLSLSLGSLGPERDS